MTKQCQNCGLENRPSANFCRRCGRSPTVVTPKADAPAPPRKTSKTRRAILLIGIMGICLILALGSWLIFFRNSASELAGSNSESLISAISSSGTVASPVGTVENSVQAGILESTATQQPETPALLSTETLNPAPQATPTLGPLIIPGTDIEVPRISDAEEIEIGQGVAQEIAAIYGVLKDEALESKISRIGQSILPYSERPNLPYQFALLNTPEINAFAAPGGFIFVSKGMLDFTATDGELAAVLAHEIAHVAQRHGAEEIETLALAEAGLNVLLQEEPEIANLYEMEDGRFVADMTALLVARGWSRANELEADKFGLIYMSKAGYEPREAVTLMKRMQQAFPETQGETDIFAHLSRTHPPFEDRIQYAETVILENGL